MLVCFIPFVHLSNTPLATASSVPLPKALRQAVFFGFFFNPSLLLPSPGPRAEETEEANADREANASKKEKHGQHKDRQGTTREIR